MARNGEGRRGRTGDTDGERAGASTDELMTLDASGSLEPPAPDAKGESGDRSAGKAAREVVYRKFSAMLPDEMIRKLEARAIVTGESKSEMLQRALEPVVKGVRLPSVPGFGTKGTVEVSAN